MSLISGTSLGHLFHQEVQDELAKHPASPSGVLTGQDLVALPEPVRRYFQASGFVGRPRVVNLRLEWEHLRLKRSREVDWMELECEQFNSVPQPVRIVLMRTKLAGLVPFEGRDKYQDGHGNMLVRVGRVFTVADAKGSPMDASGLVTVLAEALLAPSYALQPYASWQPVDATCARARFTFGGISVSGTFHFNGADELVRFDTEDRWQDGHPPRKVPWSANLGAYRRDDGLRFPTTLSATWHEPGGDFTYVEGTLRGLTYNVKG